MDEVIVVREEIDNEMAVDLEGVGTTTLINQYSCGLKRRDQSGRGFTNIEVVHGRRIAVSVTAGEDEYGLASVLIVVFAVTYRASFDSLPSFLRDHYFDEDDEDLDPKPKVVVIGITDLEGQRVVSKEEAEQFAQTNNAVYLEIRATDPNSTRAAFRRAVEVFMGKTAMHEAAWNGDVSKIEEVFGTLGEQSIDTPDWQGQTPLHCAAEKGDVSVIEALVRLGSKAIDTPDSKGTPLFAAARKGHVSVIEALVRLGSNAIDTSKYGQTPLYEAASNGHASVIETLVRLGSNAIDTPANNRWTPLYAAAQNGHASMIELLLRLGSKAIDTPDIYNGYTPLFAALLNGHVSVIETLVRLGSNAIDIPDKYGRTPLQIGFDLKPECRRMLQALSANPTSPIEVRGEKIELTEEEVLEVRSRVYFGESLAHRLLFGGALSSKDVHSSTIRIG